MVIEQKKSRYTKSIINMLCHESRTKPGELTGILPTIPGLPVEACTVWVRRKLRWLAITVNSDATAHHESEMKLLSTQLSKLCIDLEGLSKRQNLRIAGVREVKES